MSNKSSIMFHKASKFKGKVNIGLLGDVAGGGRYPRHTKITPIFHVYCKHLNGINEKKSEMRDN